MKKIVKKSVVSMFIILTLVITNLSYAAPNPSKNSNLEWARKLHLRYEDLISDEEWEKECLRMCELKADCQEEVKVKPKKTKTRRREKPKKVVIQDEECLDDCVEECLRCGPLSAESIAAELISLLAEKCRGSVKENVYMSLIIIGKPAVKPLMQAINNYNNNCVEITCMEILEEIGPDARAAGRVVAKKLHDGNRNIRMSAAKTLVKIKPTRSVVEDLLIGLGDSDAEVRKYSAVALGKMGTLGLPATAKLLRLAIGDDEVVVRKAATSAIGNLGPGASFAVSGLMVIMDKESEKSTEGRIVSLYAAKSLLQISPGDRGPAEKIISSIDPNKEKDFASHLLFKLGNIVKPDIERALLREKSGSMMHKRLSAILKRINAKQHSKKKGAK